MSRIATTTATAGDSLPAAIGRLRFLRVLAVLFRIQRVG